MAGASPFGATTCWNCGQAMRLGAERCLYCGVTLAAGPAGGAPAAAAEVAAASPAPPAPVAAPAPAASAPQAGAPLISVGAPIVVAPRVRQAPTPLPSEFAGTVAGVGRQLLAWAIDVLAAVGLAAGVGLLTGSLVFAVVALVEAAVLLWVIEARTGATLGNLLLRVRASRDEAPLSPGAARAGAWRLTVLAGALVGLVVGGAVVVASGFADGSGQHRSWADRLAGTRRVVPLPRAARQAASVAAPPVTTVSAPTMVAPAVLLADDLEISADRTDAPPAVAGVAPLVPPAAVPLVADPATAVAPVAEEAPEVLAGVVAPDLEAASGVESTVVTVLPSGVSTLLLVFDTGQRERVPTPAAINLGRAPTGTEPGDRAIKVQDPESTVSKSHVRIEHSRGQTWVVDLGSTNGTTLLGDDGTTTRLQKGERRELEEGARVRIGNRTFTVNLILGGEG
ncbi:FHA domain-containing protein [Protaetiibacter intestinalis]|uniref:FHA domain-containing protein n=1 Tax=Protaetiibacter intestinalis TaxID=2419774 RepID=A0A387BGV8_9MICO|nr:FHA domain-containing protein [Protaetiibacter intestinalis]AYF97750.1 FHA domain-containing protein [Protaetiibacter intestinalis]